MKRRPARPDGSSERFCSKAACCWSAAKCWSSLPISCRYPRLRAHFGLTEEEIYAYVQYLRQVAHVVRPSPTVKAPMRDANDVFILQTAVVGDADVTCTWDASFYDPKTLAFCARLGIHVCDDRAPIEPA